MSLACTRMIGIDVTKGKENNNSAGGCSKQITN